MAKVFEDYFSELQTDMLSICMEYAHDKVDNIYVYCSAEDNMFTAGFFYRINGKLLKRHEINKENPECDVSVGIQKQVMQILIDDLKEIQKRCIEFDMAMPTEMKIVYDANANKLDANYSYEKIISGDSDLTAYEVEKNWFEQLDA